MNHEVLAFAANIKRYGTSVEAANSFGLLSGVGNEIGDFALDHSDR